jgi:putative colanic acid biosynthesis acetyltransferase WcaF
MIVQPYKNELPLSSKIKRAVWEVVNLCLFRPTPRWGFNGWRIALLRAFGAEIGKGCRVAPSCKIWAPWNLTMKGYTCLGPGVDCYSMAPITLGVKVTVSQRVFLCTGTHETHTPEKRLITKPIKVEDHAWIAAEAFVHPGVTIGEGAVIGARSVVTKDMPEWSVCAGHPCRAIKERRRTE